MVSEDKRLETIISLAMSELARRSNLKLSPAQREARARNAEKARAARKEKRERVINDKIPA